jgi:hypothetical protein
MIQALAPGVCPHVVGQLVLKTTNVRVLLTGQPALTAVDLVQIAGCPFQIPATPVKPQPCVTAKLVPATRVFVNGSPAVVNQPGTAICTSIEQIPAGPATIVSQVRVVAT